MYISKDYTKTKKKFAGYVMNKEEKEVIDEKVAAAAKEDYGAISLANSNEAFYCLSIIGQIEGHYVLDSNQKSTKYDHILPLLVALEESEKVDGILILLNTLGGDVEAGLAIAELIASMSKPTASIVIGGGHSIGVPLAVSARRSFIVPSATMTIHPVRTSGLVLGVPQAFDYLEKMQNRIINFITAHSRVGDSTLREFINRTDMLVNDIGSVLDGYEACRCGLIDEMGGITEALNYLRKECAASKKSRKNAAAKSKKE